MAASIPCVLRSCSVVDKVTKELDIHGGMRHVLPLSEGPSSCPEKHVNGQPHTFSSIAAAILEARKNAGCVSLTWRFVILRKQPVLISHRSPLSGSCRRPRSLHLPKAPVATPQKPDATHIFNTIVADSLERDVLMASPEKGLC